MAGRGGARPGSGAKKGQHRVHVGELRSALENTLGMPYAEVLALMNLKLLNDFTNGINVKECIIFTENMSKRILEQPVHEVTVINPLEELSPEEVQERIDNLLTRAALSQLPSNTSTQSTTLDATTADALTDQLIHNTPQHVFIEQSKGN